MLFHGKEILEGVMRKLLTKTAAALALGGIALSAAAPADARHYYGGWRGGYYHHYHGGRTAAVLGAGILGLAAGAAIASGPRYYYDAGPAYYDYGPSYYAPPPPPPGYYDYGPYCRSGWRWDGWAQRYIRVRYCD